LRLRRDWSHASSAECGVRNDKQKMTSGQFGVGNSYFPGFLRAVLIEDTVMARI
jgi:hypothetical protein